MRQGDSHTVIAFYIISFSNETSIFILVQIIIYFHLVLELLHSCCIIFISLSTCSFTDVGNSTRYCSNPYTTPDTLINNLRGTAPRVSLAPQIPFP